MAIVPERKILPVAAINMGTTEWTSIIQVVERRPPQTGKSNNGRPGKRYRRYLFVDEEGTKVSGIVYDENIQCLEYNLLPFQRYKISNAKLIDAIAFFKVGPYPFSWVLDYKKLIEPIADDVPRTIPFDYPVCDFTDFLKHVDRESYFNVKGIVLKVFPRKQVGPKSTLRDIVIIDERKMPVVLTLWDNFGDVEGLQLANLLPSIPIIVATNVKATTFHGVSLATRTYSYILINPPLADNLTLRAWHEDNIADITKYVKEYAFWDPAILLLPPAEEDTIGVSAGICALSLGRSGWVAGKPVLKPTKYKPWLHVCQTCKRTLDCPLEWVIRCMKCGESSGVEVRGRIQIQLTEGNDELTVTIKSPDIEVLTGVTPQQLKDSHEFGLNIEEELREKLENLLLR